METRFTRRRGLQMKTYFTLLSCSHGSKVGRSGIGLWMRASNQASRISHVPARPAKQTRVIMMMGRMIVTVEMTIKKSSMTRLSIRLKRGRVRLENDG
jgi:hypothetical protein